MSFEIYFGQHQFRIENKSIQILPKLVIKLLNASLFCFKSFCETRNSLEYISLIRNMSPVVIYLLTCTLVCIVYFSNLHFYSFRKQLLFIPMLFENLRHFLTKKILATLRATHDTLQKIIKIMMLPKSTVYNLKIFLHQSWLFDSIYIFLRKLNLFQKFFNSFLINRVNQNQKSRITKCSTVFQAVNQVYPNYPCIVCGCV